MGTINYSNPGWTNGTTPAINQTNLNNVSNAIATLGAAFDNATGAGLASFNTTNVGTNWFAALTAALGANWTTALASALGANWTTALASAIGTGGVISKAATGTWTTGTAAGAGATTSIPSGSMVHVNISGAVPSGGATTATIQWYDGATWRIIASSGLLPSSGQQGNTTAFCIGSTGSNYRIVNNFTNAWTTYYLAW